MTVLVIVLVTVDVVPDSVSGELLVVVGLMVVEPVEIPVDGAGAPAGWQPTVVVPTVKPTPLEQVVTEPT